MLSKVPPKVGHFSCMPNSGTNSVVPQMHSKATHPVRSQPVVHSVQPQVRTQTGSIRHRQMRAGP
jgi:hypothetical protein